MKKLIFVAAMLMVLGAGCARSQSSKPAQGPITNDAVDQLSQAQVEEKCFPLKLKNGEYLYTLKDAEALFGGTWKLDELFIDPEPSIKWLHCAYYMQEAGSRKQIIVQTGPPGEFPSGDKLGKTFSGIGDRAAMEASTDSTPGTPYRHLVIQKGNLYLDVVCGDGKNSCSDEEYQKIGQTISSRLP
ncbi:MAG: hypothetical protein Q7N87_01145 [Candidatus Uhrbacteria bacterium]|nr:hypothetical protein [Candidatus Uhrbacteria bacterium]